jgi:hypothetical protein
MPRGRKSKFTAPQLAFLEEEYPKFEEAQRSGKLPRFWPKMQNKYFREWSVEDELGIIVNEQESAEGSSGMSVEDATKLGQATKDRKQVGLKAFIPLNASSRVSRVLTRRSHSN